MPTLDALEYERFSYDETNPNPLSLDEAVKQAAELRRSDPTNFYRVESADENNASFKVTKVPVASVYADFLARAAKAMSKYLIRVQHK